LRSLTSTVTCMSFFGEEQLPNRAIKNNLVIVFFISTNMQELV